MSALTFESINNSHRRAAARRTPRQSKPSGNLSDQRARQAAIASLSALHAKIQNSGVSNKSGIAGLVVLTLVLHAAIISSINRPGTIQAIKTPAPPPLSIDIAPPPPPPPVVIPKPIPQVAKPQPVAKPVPVPQNVPVVNDTPVDNTPSPDAVRVATAAPAPTPPAPPAPAPVEKITEPRGFAGYLNNPAPSYPPEALLKGYHGLVILNVHVLASGLPDSITVLKTSGQRLLDDAAIKTVTSWKFEPAKRGETPIDAFVKVPLNFKLS